MMEAKKFKAADLVKEVMDVAIVTPIHAQEVVDREMQVLIGPREYGNAAKKYLARKLSYKLLGYGLLKSREDVSSMRAIYKAEVTVVAKPDELSRKMHSAIQTAYLKGLSHGMAKRVIEEERNA